MNRAAVMATIYA